MIPKRPDDGPEIVRTELAGAPGPMRERGESSGSSQGPETVPVAKMIPTVICRSASGLARPGEDAVDTLSMLG